MRWFASLLLALVLPASLSAQQGGGDAASRVRQDLATRWKRPVDQVILRWLEDVPHEGQIERIVGSGRDGHFVVLFEQGSGRLRGMRLRAGTRDSVAVAARPLERDHVLQAGDWRWQDTVQWGGYSVSPSPLLGGVVRRAAPEGTPLIPPLVTPPVVAHFGERIQVVLIRPWGTLRFGGVLQQDAYVGSLVPVLLDHGSRRVRARVSEDGTFTWNGS